MVDAVTAIRRRLIALAAAYAIALQAVVAGFAALAAAGTAVPGLCTSSAPQEQPGRDTGHAIACIACPASCCDGGLYGAPPTGVAIPAPRSAFNRGEHKLLQLAARVTSRDRPPSRGPPVG
jgi:hypothetical protein